MRSGVGSAARLRWAPPLMRTRPALSQLLQGSMGCGWVGAALLGVPCTAADHASLAPLAVPATLRWVARPPPPSLRS